MATNSSEQLLPQWEALGQKAFEVALNIAQEASFPDADEKQREVKLWATCLLCRTINNFDAMQLLLKESFIVESRTMARCCYENLFRIAYLTKKRYAAIEEWDKDWQASTKTVASELAAFSVAGEPTSDKTDEFSTFMQKLLETESKKGRSLHAEAKEGGVLDEYLTYRMLSRDAAHPNVMVLPRHHYKQQDGTSAISAESRWLDDNEDLDTWDLGTKALLLACGGANELLALQRGKDIEKVLEEHKQLSAFSLSLGK